MKVSIGLYIFFSYGCELFNIFMSHNFECKYNKDGVCILWKSIENIRHIAYTPLFCVKDCAILHRH